MSEVQLKYRNREIVHARPVKAADVGKFESEIAPEDQLDNGNLVIQEQDGVHRIVDSDDVKNFFATGGTGNSIRFEA